MATPGSSSAALGDLHALHREARTRDAHALFARLRPAAFAVAAGVVIATVAWLQMTSIPRCHICEGVHTWPYARAGLVIATAVALAAFVAWADRRAPEKIRIEL